MTRERCLDRKVAFGKQDTVKISEKECVICRQSHGEEAKCSRSNRGKEIIEAPYGEVAIATRFVKPDEIREFNQEC